MGIIADKTKKLEEVTKILYSIGVISLMCIGLVSRKSKIILTKKKFDCMSSSSLMK